jgi:exodeoxyribonuclease V beta subunit
VLPNLHQHAVIEASAGTGKTHAIEQIVLRLLLEEQVPLEQMLLVTFTEKASGELKGRLRKALEVKLREDAEQTSLQWPLSPELEGGAARKSKPALARSDFNQRSLLRTAIDSFDQASIFTIHGFCRRLLAEYALEQGHDLRGELINDGDLVEPALREVQRRL